MKYNVITFGSATRDNYLFLKSERKYIIGHRQSVNGKSLCFPLGSKTEVQDMQVLSGGGGTNTAATFASQGFKVAYVGKVGQDKRGEALIEELRQRSIDTQFVKRDAKHATAYSLLISLASGERNIFVYRGASNFLTKSEIPWSELRDSQWFYLAPFSGSLAKLTEPIINFANQNKIKIAFNPGYSQLSFPPATLKRILAKVDVLILNQEEASLLTKIPFQKEASIFRKIDSLVKDIVVMTKGKEGAVASDGRYLYHTPGVKVGITDRTGAGDSFGAGLVAGLMQKKSIEAALQLASANAAFCLRKRGAKSGLLKKGQKYPKVKVVRQKCLRETKRC